METLRRSRAGYPPLHRAEISHLAVPNRIFAAVYAFALIILFYHHIKTLKTTNNSVIPSLLLFAADLVLAFMWTTTQAFRVRPLRRTEYPELLKMPAKDEDQDHSFVPAMDVFVCTADPFKEPPVGVAVTVLSAMAYDYPPEKLSVYVSDDGGSELTLFAFFEAARFAAHWLPFCRRFNVLKRSPGDFFDDDTDRAVCPEAENIKILYENMKAKIETVVEKRRVGYEYIVGEEEKRVFSQWTDNFTRQDHPTVIQVILDKSNNRDVTGCVMPSLIYVSREKRKSSMHHFKAGALNALIRVSATMSNAPIILTLDCDMSSNDPQTPMRALCYFSDPTLQPKLGYVQFPQRFKGINKNDIYGSELKRLFVINPEGMDGLLGPNHVGTGCFFSRRVFFGGPTNLVLPELPELGPHFVATKPIQSLEVLKLAHHVAGINYESQTQWGFEIGVRYGSLVEDYFTGYRVQCEGWKSIFCNPKRTAFYGNAPVSLIDVLNQNKRWSVGLLEVAFSKFCPLTFGARLMGPLMGLSYAHIAFWPIWSFPVVVYAFLPQLALLNGTSIFPKVSEIWFILYLFLFIGAYGQDLVDFMVGGGTMKQWWNEQRMWLIRGLSSYLFGSIEYFMKQLRISTFGFNVTSKVNDEEQSQRYQKGKFDYGVHSPLFVVLTMAAMTNLVALIWGLIIAISRGGSDFDKKIMQLLLAFFAVLNCFPVYEATVFRSSSKGGVHTKTIFLSAILTSALFAMAFVTLLRV